MQKKSFQTELFIAKVRIQVSFSFYVKNKCRLPAYLEACLTYKIKFFKVLDRFPNMHLYEFCAKRF